MFNIGYNYCLYIGFILDALKMDEVDVVSLYIKNLMLVKLTGFKMHKYHLKENHDSSSWTFSVLFSQVITRLFAN